jgi:5-methyltetrahydropteroyltriglutamate--homocysteine methyltransferase
VGSLLRPPALLQARIDFGVERLDLTGLRAEEDRAIVEALCRQRDCGIDVYSDGEFRRASFQTGFPDAVEGFSPADVPSLPWKGGDGPGPPTGRGYIVTGRLRARGRIAGVESAFLRQHARGAFKIALPSPMLGATAAYRPGVTDDVYATREDLIADAAAILANEARQLAAEGVPYIQVDAPSYALWLDRGRGAGRNAGGDRSPLLDAAIAADNLVLDAAREGGATTAVHLCRGNLMGRWLAEGGYDPIAERLFRQLRCDRLLLEYDTPRAGSFAPLRFVPASKVVVLGLITTKVGALESRDELLRRIDEASRIVPLEQLALSTQCGFASSQAGNPLTHDDQWRKLELVAELAREVWP